MHTSKFITVILLGCVVSSCGLISGKSDRKAAYKEGYIDGGANERKRQYWANQDAVTSSLLPVSPQPLPTVVPAHTDPDGVIIEEHKVEDQLESVEP